MLKSIEWKKNHIRFLDQRQLPLKENFIETQDFRVIADAISALGLRGAPLIGVGAAYGIALGAQEALNGHRDQYFSFLESVDQTLRSTRPTAVNLFWALDRMKKIWKDAEIQGILPHDCTEKLLEEAIKIHNEDIQTNQSIAKQGSSLIQDEDAILTHCNAGALACSAWGTALGVVYWAALQEGKKLTVYADETRPLLQGARLTTFELLKNHIPVTLITDNMAGYLMARGQIHKIIVGADRIAVNGDTANKIGTYSLAVLASHHNIPFYVAAPLSTIDIHITSGEDIPIEERKPEEVFYFGEKRIAPQGIEAWNPAFDVTPHQLIRAIITEKGILYPPFVEKLTLLKQDE
ncbi:MAG: S-methyl-5-thioribose-1-phosphate isomerase [Candidatus Atribacteria bacterium]|nr:S-methyl-5-thioribose-1-phosphate isomerase [Candidatus Atribacteria bacterium]